MKKIEAFVRHEAFEPIRTELLDKGFPSLSLSEVKGSGRQKGIVETYRGSTLTVNVRPKLKIEVVVEDKDKSLVVETILKHARTGDVGDGKIFVIPVEEAIRIRTGEEGDDVLQAHPEAGGRLGSMEDTPRASRPGGVFLSGPPDARPPGTDARRAPGGRRAGGRRGARGSGGGRPGRDRAPGARPRCRIGARRRSGRARQDARGTLRRDEPVEGVECEVPVIAGDERIGWALALAAEPQRASPRRGRPRGGPEGRCARFAHRARRHRRARRGRRRASRHPPRGAPSQEGRGRRGRTPGGADGLRPERAAPSPSSPRCRAHDRATRRPWSPASIPAPLPRRSARRTRPTPRVVRIYALLPARAGDDPSGATIASARRISERLRSLGPSAFSSFCETPSELDRAIAEAELMLDVIGRDERMASQLGSGVGDGVYRLLFRAMASDPEEVRRFYSDTVEPLVAHDREYRTDLLGTLEAYLVERLQHERDGPGGLRAPPHRRPPPRPHPRAVRPRPRLGRGPRAPRPRHQGLPDHRADAAEVGG